MLARRAAPAAVKVFSSVVLTSGRSHSTFRLRRRRMPRRANRARHPFCGTSFVSSMIAESNRIRRPCRRRVRAWSLCPPSPRPAPTRAVSGEPTGAARSPRSARRRPRARSAESEGERDRAPRPAAWRRVGSRCSSSCGAACNVAAAMAGAARRAGPPRGIRRPPRGAPRDAGARGGWIKAGLTWQNIAYQASRGRIDPAQSRWFAQFALLKGSAPRRSTAYGSEWITVDEFESPLLWALLDEAGRGSASRSSGRMSRPTVLVRGRRRVGARCVGDGGDLVLAPHAHAGCATRTRSRRHPRRRGARRVPIRLRRGLYASTSRAYASGAIGPAEQALLERPATRSACRRPRCRSSSRRTSTRSPGRSR